MSVTEIIPIYGMKGAVRIFTNRDEIEMEDVKNVCCIHINLVAHKWLLFMWKGKKRLTESQEGKMKSGLEDRTRETFCDFKKGKNWRNIVGKTV